MKRTFPLLFAFLLYAVSSWSQATATEGKVEHTKGDKVAAIIELPYPTDEVEAAIKDYLARRGAKSEKAKGFHTFRGVKLYENDTEVSDLHFKVERKSRRESNITVVYLLVGRPSENVGLRGTTDHHKLDEAKLWLNRVVPVVDAHHLEVQINEQVEILKKADKKMQGLVEDSVSLTEKIKALQTKFDTNRIDQQKQVEEVARQREILEAMRQRRKP